MSDRWWRPRQPNEATAVYLGRVLDDLGDATDLADRARLGHFDDYRCPPGVDDGANILRLVNELGDWARSATPDQRRRATAVILAAKGGEFDGTRAEFDQWRESPDGERTLCALLATGPPSFGPEPDPDPRMNGLWVGSAVIADGAYGVEISAGPDHAWSLDRAQAIAYAVACFRRATEADHDAAVFALLTGPIELPKPVAAQMLLQHLRPNRSDEHLPTAPLRFTTRLNHRARPFLTMALGDTTLGMMSPSDLRDHAAGVLNALAAAELDGKLHRVLVEDVDLDPDRAQQFVDSLGEHWPPEWTSTPDPGSAHRQGGGDDTPE